MTHRNDSFSALGPVHGPRLSGLMHAVGLDVSYHRALGDELYYHDARGAETAVLDLVGGYGSLVLGHHHPELVEAVTDFLAAGRPVQAQGSLRPITEAFASALDQRAGGGHCVVLANTGAEAIEAAMKHAMLATAGRTFVALEGAFHGKTLSALRLAGHASHREPFETDGSGEPNVHRVRLNDITHLEQAFREVRNPAGFIFEPIHGEGGVRLMDRAFARRAAELCRERGIPMIADECQTGMGRTGRFLGSEHLGVQPDYIVLSKALGGGLAKIAALLVRREQYRSAFDLMHTSTFAGDELSSAVGLKAIALTDEALLNQIQQRGTCLLEALQAVAREYPDIVAEVRGRGLMLAIELRPLHRSNSFTLRTLTATDDLALLAAAYLLREHHVRVAPTLSAPNTLRIQPSAFISDSHIDQAIRGFTALCACLRRGDGPGLTAHLTNQPAEAEPPRSLREGFKVCSYRPGTFAAAGPSPARRVAWLCHMIDDADLVSLEPAYIEHTRDRRNRLLDRLAPLANPVVMSEVDVRSARGDVVRLYPILLPVTSAWMKRCIDADDTGAAEALVGKGVDIARHLGCSLAALGQYTSIVTRGGRRLPVSNIGLATGNTYSLSLAIEAIEQAEAKQGIDPSAAVCAVVGAAGNIGQTAARLLSQRYRRTLLLGSTRSNARARLHRLERALQRVQVIEDPALLRSADVILAATNAVHQSIGPEHLASGAIVCDLSVPAAVGEELRISRPDLTLIRGGIVRLPYEEDLDIVGFPLSTGRTYGCMGEALLLGFEGIADRSYTGLVRPEGVSRLAGLAQRHGFALDQHKDHCVLGTQNREVAHVPTFA